MAYAMRFERAARAELDLACETYGEGFSAEIRSWLSELARAAEEGKSSVGENVQRLAEELLNDAPSSIRHSWARLRTASTREKLQALLTLLTKRCPPWELWADLRHFTVVGTFPAEVLVYYEVDHVKKQVVFRRFQGLPGQDG